MELKDLKLVLEALEQLVKEILVVMEKIVMEVCQSLAVAAAVLALLALLVLDPQREMVV
jgi:hypothetical protein